MVLVVVVLFVEFLLLKKKTLDGICSSSTGGAVVAPSSTLVPLLEFPSGYPTAPVSLAATGPHATGNAYYVSYMLSTLAINVTSGTTSAGVPS